MNSTREKRSEKAEPKTGVGNGHASCLLCGWENPRSLELDFRATEDGGVTATFRSRPELQGYDHLLHGGMIAALLDAAMTHCLFHAGVRAVTADLRVRYLRPVSCDAVIRLRARILAATPRLFRLRAEALVDEVAVAWGEGKFMPQEKMGRSAR